VVDGDALGARLAAAGVTAQIERGTPNLEDVFVAATQRPARAAEAAA